MLLEAHNLHFLLCLLRLCQSHTNDQNIMATLHAHLLPSSFNNMPLITKTWRPEYKWREKSNEINWIKCGGLASCIFLLLASDCVEPFTNSSLTIKNISKFLSSKGNTHLYKVNRLALEISNIKKTVNSFHWRENAIIKGSIARHLEKFKLIRQSQQGFVKVKSCLIY